MDNFSGQLTTQHDQALRQLQHLAELGRVSASLLHEISTPLTAAMLNLEQQAQSSTELRIARQNLQTLRRYVDAARRQVLHQSEAVVFKLRPQVDLVKRIVVPLARSHHVQLTFDAVPSCQLHGDMVKLQQVMVNLICNALDAYRNDISHGLAKPVKVVFSTQKGRLEIRVIDWGEGISASQLPHLFEPFYTTKNIDGNRGLGIGLSIVQQYVHEFGGTIHVRTSRRQGTHFILSLPTQ